MVAAGPLTGALGAREVWWISAAVFALAGLVGYTLLGEEAGESATPETAVS